MNYAHAHRFPADVDNETIEVGNKMSRRSFITKLGIATGAVIAGGLLFDSNPVDAAQEEESTSSDNLQSTLNKGVNYQSDAEVILPSNPDVKVIREPQDVEEDSTNGFSPFKDFANWYEYDFTSVDQSVLTSIKQDMIATYGSLAVTLPLGALGLPVGNAGLSEILKDPEKLAKLPPFGQLMLKTSVVAPFVEELVFRAAPSALINLFSKSESTTTSRLGFGLATSALFAQAHNIGAQKKSLPIPQFVGGMALWRINRSKGLINAAVAHGATNALIFSIAGPSIEKKRKAAIIAQSNSGSKRGQPNAIDSLIIDAYRKRINDSLAKNESVNDDMKKLLRDFYGDDFPG